MTNILNSIIANQPIRKPSSKAALPAFTFDAEGKIKPLDDKAKLLPSRIFGSPIEYAKDLKQDIVNIGRAATGKANDHELGRINDVAMKLGALGLAGYLFAKTPGKLAKAMEFVGAGTFFGSMALWPKLAIQAPLKARTGVDIHQKYIDSQGRKKMLHQDPQYDLTDLYSREDLDKMGKKLGVSENLPDRDSFIKQRAKKTATQGNTLWMMTAGVATPVMSALACNVLEKPLEKAIETFDLTTTQRTLDKVAQGNTVGGVGAKVKEYFSHRALNKFLQQNADKALDEKTASQIAALLGKNTNMPSMQTAIMENLQKMKNSVVIDESFVKSALKNLIPDGVIENLSVQERAALDKAMQKNSVGSIAKILAKHVDPSNAKNAQKNVQLLGKKLTQAVHSAEKPTVGGISEAVKTMNTSLVEFSKGKGVLDKFIRARIGDTSDSYIAHQWNKVSKAITSQLKFSGKELKQLNAGNMSVLNEKLMALAADEQQYDKVVSKLTKYINNYETQTGSTFVTKVQDYVQKLTAKTAKSLADNGFDDLAQKISSNVQKGTVTKIVNGELKERIPGAQSSFYRILETLDFAKRLQNGSVKEQIRTALQTAGKNADDDVVEGFVKLAKTVLLDATGTSYIEKLQTSGFENIVGKGKVSSEEYKIVMNALFGDKAGSAVKESLERAGIGADDALKGFSKFKASFKKFVLNSANDVKTELGGYALDSEAGKKVESQLVGKHVSEFFKQGGKNLYNSNKWLKIFGGTMIGLTLVTLVAGLAIGRKGKMEKQVEQESKVNG